MSAHARTALALNLGSTSLKAVSYSLTDDAVAGGAVAVESERVAVQIKSGPATSLQDDARAWLASAAALLSSLHGEPDLVVHRIVHGGDRAGPAELTPQALSGLQELAPLAPLHQPPALAVVAAAMERWPVARQFGAFDTSWHRTMPELHRLLPIPYRLYSQGVRRYGFHGLAFQSAMRQLDRIEPALCQRRIVLAHLGGGGSLCAVLQGKSVRTTMAMTPLDGIIMGSRSGSLDPGVLLHLQRSLGLSLDEVEELLWRDSGMKGISDESGDMRELLASNSDGARRAIDVFVSSVAQGIAGMAACIRGIDALVFSGGIGMNAPAIRSRVTDELRWMGIAIDPGQNEAGAPDISAADAAVRTFVLPVDEAREMVGAIAAL